MEVNKAILEGMVLESAFNDILNEGSLIDWWIKTRASDRAYRDELKGHDIIDVHNAIINIDDVIDAVQRLRKSSKTVHVDKDKFFIFNTGPHHTKFTSSELDAYLANLRAKKSKLVAIYNKMGGEQIYYTAITTMAQQDMADAQRASAQAQMASAQAQRDMANAQRVAAQQAAIANAHAQQAAMLATNMNNGFM